MRYLLPLAIALVVTLLATGCFKPLEHENEIYNPDTQQWEHDEGARGGGHFGG